MSRAVFETATLADAINQAARIAPNKGTAYDRAAGVVIEIWPDTPAIIKSTDLEISFRKAISVVDCDAPATWRVSANLANAFMATLPLGSGSQIIVGDKHDGNLYFRCGKTRAKLRQIVGDYPLIVPYSHDELEMVPGFAGRLKQVTWACDSRQSHSVLGGVHLDGQFLIGCNRESAAIVPCVVPVDRPVTAPLSEVASLIKNTSEVWLRASSDKLLLSPDEWTQTTCVLYAESYPNVRGLLHDRYTNRMIVQVDALLKALERMMVLVKQERFPVTSMTIDNGSLALEMDVPDVGRIADEIEIIGGSGTPFTISINPQRLIAAITASGRAVVTVDFGPTPLSDLRITDDADYIALLMPRKVRSE